MFFSFDGLDGVGKTTQMDLFSDWLRAAGHEVVSCQDPGSTPLGEIVRKILLERGNTPIDRRSEMLLFMVARAQLVAELIKPSLAAGKTIVSDRYLLANAVYQGHAGGLNVDEIWQIGQVATAGVKPDLTFVLDLDPDAARKRIERPLDRMEIQTDDFQRRLRTGFLAEAARRPNEIIVIDAGRSVDEVQADIRRHAQRVLGK
jgi:dTMP kinase